MIRHIWKKINTLSNGNLYKFFRFLIRIIIIPLTYMIWVVEPFKKIRIHRGQTSRIGHLSSYFEVLVRSKEIDISGKSRLDIFIVKKRPANKTLYNMWKKHLYFIESNFLDAIYHLCSPWLKNRKHFGPKDVGHASLPPSKATLTFTKEQNQKGINLAKEIGINKKDWFVCLHERSSTYLQERFKIRNYSRHNIRDCSFNMLFESAELIKANEGKCVRMSSGNKEKLSKNAPSNIIDYATTAQSDFMDIYLPAKCKFFLGSQTGLLNVSQIFNVPVAATNCIPVNAASVPLNSLFIPKLMWFKKEKRFLSYKEILEKKLNHVLFSSDLLSLGIEIIENDNNDIKLLTEDMFDLINNKKLSSKDEKTRTDFMNNYFYESKFVNKNIVNSKFIYSGKISWRFLNKHSYLMNK